MRPDLLWQGIVADLRRPTVIDVVMSPTHTTHALTSVDVPLAPCDNQRQTLESALMTSPSVNVSLSPAGRLQIELPGHGPDRVIELKWTDAVDPAATIKRVLKGLAQQQSSIGLEGAPTAQQVKHWESHQQFPNDKCPFCKRESRQRATAASRALFADDGPKFKPTILPAARRKRLGEVTVRVLKSRTKKEIVPEGLGL